VLIVGEPSQSTVAVRGADVVRGDASVIQSDKRPWWRPNRESPEGTLDSGAMSQIVDQFDRAGSDADHRGRRGGVRVMTHSVLTNIQASKFELVVMHSGTPWHGLARERSCSRSTESMPPGTCSNGKPLGFLRSHPTRLLDQEAWPKRAAVS